MIKINTHYEGGDAFRHESGVLFYDLYIDGNKVLSTTDINVINTYLSNKTV